MGQVRDSSASTQRVMSIEWLLDTIKDHKKKLCRSEVAEGGGVLAPEAKGVCLLGPNSRREPNDT